MPRSRVSSRAAAATSSRARSAIDRTPADPRTSTTTEIASAMSITPMVVGRPISRSLRKASSAVTASRAATMANSSMTVRDSMRLAGNRHGSRHAPPVAIV